MLIVGYNDRQEASLGRGFPVGVGGMQSCSLPSGKSGIWGEQKKNGERMVAY